MIAGIAFADVREKVDERQDQAQHEDRGNKEMKRGIPSGVMREGLIFCFGHGERLLG